MKEAFGKLLWYCCLLSGLFPATVISRLVISNDPYLFKSETVRSSSVGNVTIVSYGYHAEGKMPSWARKAFLVEAESWGEECGIELLAITIGPKALVYDRRRRWAGSLSVFDILDRKIVELKCLSAPPYGHSYPIPEAVVPRTLAIYCRVPKTEKGMCLDLNGGVKSAKFSMLTGDIAGYSAVFEPRPADSRRRSEDYSREHKRILTISVNPLPEMTSEMKAKFHMWVAYHRQLGLTIAAAVESTQVLDSMPAAVLNDEEVIVYAPGILSSISYYDHVGGKKRGKYRRHFDSDKTLTTTFIRFESRIVRNADIAFVIDFDEFLYAPRAPLASSLLVTARAPNWAKRCDVISKANKLDNIVGLKKVVSGFLDEETDPRAAVVRPILESDIAKVSKVSTEKTFRWPASQLPGLKSHGQYIREIINNFSCAVDKYGFGIQIDLPRADVANENYFPSCMSDNLAAGVYSLHPCMEYMNVLQRNSATKRYFKNKVLNMGQPCSGDMIHSSCVRAVQNDMHAYGTSCSCDMFVQDELVVLHHFFRGLSPKHVKRQICAKAKEQLDGLQMDTMDFYHKNYFEASIKYYLTRAGNTSSCAKE